ncbi:MAG: phosphate acyltransferase [Halothiobacillus sp. 24-54-40]|jgi:glycerol-3-phosphate acyltransferase PlsX|nr:MAG: phosphate acyltransferase [Halothiobacillus sp. 35-54-62]OYZ88135.1 MAG: phosphate acyltransferase [Halothiobacillus sp. 24-54-40]OZA81623.1 MAG: phosphate acyltransferase [Halothiobacillus sp. 39-53-45]
MKAQIAIDMMGGDHGLPVTLAAAARFINERPHVTVLLVGDEVLLRSQLATYHLIEGERVVIVHAPEVVAMGESPAVALRTKKKSSMRVAIDCVRDGSAQAAVSAGNTGALMATAKFVLKMLPGIDRPAICTALPNRKGHTHVLDLGANVECNADHLFQFAVMGSVLVEAYDDNPSPRVGLLNVGAEAIKGNDTVKAAAALLAAGPINYIGYVEGDDIYKGDVDVVVCDGFVGNVALKASEGLAKMITQFLREEFSRGLLSKLAAVIAMPVLKRLKKRLDPGRYNGASFLGLQGIVIKSHGGADVAAFMSALNVALREIEKDVPRRIDLRLGQLLNEKELA